MRNSLKAYGRRVLRVTGAATAGGIATVGLWSGVAFAAGTGYVGGGTATPAAPSGFTNVITSQTVPTTGGTVASPYRNGQLSVKVPAGDFTGPVDVSVTAPTTTSVAGEVLALDLSFSVNGSAVKGALAQPIVFTITSPDIKVGDVVDLWNGTKWVTYTNATVADGSATITLTSDPAFAISTTSAPASTTVSGATTPTTGVPVLGLGALAFGAVAVGAGGLVTVRRRRARA